MFRVQGNVATERRDVLWRHSLLGDFKRSDMKLLVEKEFDQFEECHSDIFNKGVPVEPILNHFAVSA